jgi:hypothetical protein
LRQIGAKGRLLCQSAARLEDWAPDAAGEGMLAMTEANGEVALQDPDALVKEIEQTRANLARTIDTLAERVSPASVTKRAKSRVMGLVSRPEVQIGAAALTAVTLALVIWRRRRG